MAAQVQVARRLTAGRNVADSNGRHSCRVLIAVMTICYRISPRTRARARAQCQPRARGNRVGVFRGTVLENPEKFPLGFESMTLTPKADLSVVAVVWVLMVMAEVMDVEKMEAADASVSV